MSEELRGPSISRRGFVTFAGAAAVAAGLAACSGGAGGGSTTPIKFWDMPMGNQDFIPLDKQIVEAYKPAKGNGAVQYQAVQWANFTQVFATAVASNTGPAVSSGGGTQVFQYAAQNKIAYADDLIAEWEKSGLLADFLPGTIDALKTKDGHQAAIPQNQSMITTWYSPSLLAKAGASAPTDWPSYLAAAAALKKIGVYGLGTGSGSGNFQGGQTILALMINNGGGLFDEEQKPNCVTPRNIEAVDFVLEMVKKGYVDPGAGEYTTSNVAAQWKAGKFGLGFDVPTLADNVGASSGWDGVVGSPLAGPHGDRGTLGFLNNIMMWTNTPSQKSSEAFLDYYYRNMAPLWTKGTMTALPPLKSIMATKEFQADKVLTKVANEWQPLAKTYAAPGKSMSATVAKVDATPVINDFAQAILSGRQDAKTALQTLQTQIAS